MILGNNNNFNNMNNEFQKKINNNEQSKNISPENKDTKKKSFKNIFTKSIFSIGGSNTKNKDDMYEKSIAMLNDRLEKGTITFEEFNKKCREIAKKRNK